MEMKLTEFARIADHGYDRSCGQSVLIPTRHFDPVAMIGILAGDHVMIHIVVDDGGRTAHARVILTIVLDTFPLYNVLEALTIMVNRQDGLQGQ